MEGNKAQVNRLAKNCVDARADYGGGRKFQNSNFEVRGPSNMGPIVG